MPELVSDDDTDSEEEGSPPLKGMGALSITELSILPAIFDSPDSKQLSYEAVSAELDRHINAPQPIVVYSTHMPRWSNTRDTEHSDMLRQFISSQRGRIRDNLPEYIPIDPELTED